MCESQTLRGAVHAKPCIVAKNEIAFLENRIGNGASLQVLLVKFVQESIVASLDHDSAVSFAVLLLRHQLFLFSSSVLSLLLNYVGRHPSACFESCVQLQA